MSFDALISEPAEVLRDFGVTDTVLLKDERERRRLTREEMADRIRVKPNYYRHIEYGTNPSQEVKDAIRAVLEECPVHKEFGIACKHRLPVPPDDELYSRAKTKKA